jgi:hypothetical protein
MSIELELRLEGQDANEDTLLDLMDWLERANIDGLTIERSALPHAKGDMGGLADPSTIIAMVSTVVGLADIAINIASWRKTKEDVVVNPTLKTLEEVSQDTQAKIQTVLAEMKDKVHQKKS